MRGEEVHVLRVCSSQLWQTESSSLMHWEVLVGDILCSWGWISRGFTFSKERMNCKAEIHIVFSEWRAWNSSFLGNLTSPSAVLYMRGIPFFAVRKCYPFVLMGEEWETCRPRRNVVKALPFGKLERQSSACLLDSLGYWLPFPPAFPSSPPIQDWRGKISASS